jgi:hypothetical protein
MKAITKIQKEVDELYLKLPSISEKQYDWAYRKFKKFSLIQRNRFYCLECGHSESLKQNSEILLMKLENKTICPSCKVIAEPSIGKMPHRRAVENFKILTTFKGQQVIRIVYGYKKLKRNARAELEFHEVIQHWINEKGQVVSLSKPKPMMGFYIDSFVLSAPLAIKRSTFKDTDLFNIDPYYLCPNSKVLPIIKRNGFTIKSLTSLSPQELFPELLKNPRIETLLKAEQFKLLEYAVKYYPIGSNKLNRITINWPQIKIALRNNYIIKDPIVWLDYIDNLIKFNKDILNAKFICPIDLTVEHDRYLEKIRLHKRKEKLMLLKEQMDIDNEEYTNKKKIFFDLFFKFENISVEMIQSVQQVFDEGYELKHCVFENEYYKKDHSILLSAKVDNEVVETIEVSLNKFEILQARGLSNHPSEYNKRIVKLVNDNIKEIKKRTKKYLKEVA